MRGRHSSCLTACGPKITREGHQCTSTNDAVVASRYSTIYCQTSPTKTDGVSESAQCVHEHAFGDTQSQNVPTCVGAQIREALRQPKKAVTCGENQAARNQTVDAPSVHQRDARWNTPLHAHGSSNHTMDTTGTCHPQKLRWHALTWKPTANGEHPTPTKQGMCHNSSDAAQKPRTQQQIWLTNPHIKSNFLPLGKHDFVTNEIRTLPKKHRTRIMRHMRQTKKTAATLRRRRAFITSCVRSTKM